MRPFLIGLALFSHSLFLVANNNSENAQPAKAVEFPKEAQWLNCSYPLRLQDFNQRFLMLNFWTSGSTLCTAQIHELNRLHTAHKNLDIIIVHSGKYTNENNAETLRQFIIEHDISFPVISDTAFALWSDYNISAWPTNLLIDPEQQVVFKSEGAHFNGEISTIISGYEGNTRISGSHGRSEINNFEQGLLVFPKFVEADGEISLFISEYRGHRIVKKDINGIFELAIGSGYAGFEDGTANLAMLHSPTGLAYNMADSVLYIADTGNDAIRKYDLKNDRVTTVLGNGQRALSPPKSISGTNHGLNQPHGLTLMEDELYIAMTGWNQIWKYNTKTGLAEPVTGTGETGFEDGRNHKAKLAEPYDITHDLDGVIYFTDLQSNAIRMLKRSKTSTLTGSGIFEFGDIDGRSSEARMSGPAGITFHNNMLYVTDQFNHKIKAVNPYNGRVETLLGSGNAGYSNGAGAAVAFHLPTGLTVLRDHLYIADTYNHVLRQFDFDGSTTTMEFRNKGQIPLMVLNEYQVLETDTIVIPEGSVRIEMVFELDSLYQLIPDAPQTAMVTTRNPLITEDPDGINPLINTVGFNLENNNTYQHFMAEIGMMYHHIERPEVAYFRTFTLMFQIETSVDAPADQVVTVPVPRLSAR